MVSSFKTILGFVTISLAAVSIDVVPGPDPPAFGVAAPLPRSLPVPMSADDGKTYAVEPGETLRNAIARGAVQETETGHCVPEPMEKKPPGSVACACYEVTECKGNESHTCKRHCRKDLCECCSI